MSAVILELQVENVKRIRAVQIVPTGETVIVSGKNDQGKSSTLDSIDYAFRGEKSICDEPIRQGEKRARAFVRLSEELENVCTVERVFTPGGTTLVVKNKEGIPQKTPQALLDSIIAKISFDPLSFVRMKGPEQMELLRKLVGLDFTNINAVRKATFDERTIRNRELETAKSKLASYPFNAALPKEPLDVVTLATQLGDAKSRNANNRQRKEAVVRQEKAIFDLAEDVRALKGKVETLKKMIVDTEAQIISKQNSFDTASIEFETMVSQIAKLQNADEGSLQKQIDDIQKTNADIEANKRHLAAMEDVELLEGSIVALTAKIKECDDDKSAQVEFANFPMPGLSFDEMRGVLLNGVPFSQGSQAKQLQAAIAIGLALNPKVRVILIRDGSLMDEQSMAAVKEMAVEKKAQVWIEVVNSKDPSAIIIEDGEVK